VILYKCQLFWRCGVTIELSLNYFGGVVILCYGHLFDRMMIGLLFWFMFCFVLMFQYFCLVSPEFDSPF